MALIETGQQAPDFTLPQDGGPDVTLSQRAPSPVVLYFYPRDDTSGCTKEALAFSELMDAFREAGAHVFGISRDPVDKHARFRAKHDLTVPLLSDADGTVCEAYGTWAEKKMYGKTFMGIARSTVLVDASGRVARCWPKVKIPGHAQEVLEAVKAH